MAQILNSGYEENTTVYNDQTASNAQMEADQSTMTAEDEGMYKAFAQQAGEYAKKVSKKKFYDFKTKNKSFLELYQDLYKLGVKNNKFFLRLYDTDLQGVDVYSPVLPKETQIKIFIECLINPWYWLREVLRIPVDGLPIEVAGGTAYRIDRNNAACWYLFLNGIDHYQSKPRQSNSLHIFSNECVLQY